MLQKPLLFRYLAVTLSFTVLLATLPTKGHAAGGRHVGPHDSPPSRQQVQPASQDEIYGRAVIYRAGEMPRNSPSASAKPKTPAEPSRVPHFFDTTLPVLIQGMPQPWALWRIYNRG